VRLLSALSIWHNSCLSCSFKELPVDSPTKAVRAVKSLAVHMNDLSLDDVVNLMRLFPCLEKLHLKVVMSSLIVNSLRSATILILINL
jgi:hypothetical protein